MALLPETGPYSSAFLLNNSSLVGNRLRGAHIPNELLDCGTDISSGFGHGRSRLRELMLAVSRTPSWSLKVVARPGTGGW